MGAKLTGDWDRLSRKLGGLGNQLKNDTSRTIGRSLKKVERAVLSHIDEQDLDWQELSDDYANQKEKKGLSPDTLRASNGMYQNITSVQPDPWSGMVGVARGSKTDDGDDLTNIALIHEQPEDDGEVMPARKLWQPTFDELQEELAVDLQGTAIEVFKR